MREVTIKIGLERLDTQEGITVEALLDSGVLWFKTQGLSPEATLVLSNTRELDRVPSTE